MVEQSLIYPMDYDLTIDTLFPYLENGMLFTNNNLPNSDIGYRKWFVKLEDADGSIIAGTILDVNPYTLTHLQDKYIPFPEINDSSLLAIHSYAKGVLYAGVLNIINTWFEAYNIRNMVIRSEDIFPQTYELRGGLYISLRYDDDKSHDENISMYQMVVDKLNLFLNLFSKVNVFFSAPAVSDCITLRYHNVDPNKKDGYVPVPLYFWINDIDDVLTSKLPSYYNLIEDTPYRIYNANTDIFGQVILDVLNLTYYQTNGVLIINHLEEK